MITSYTKVVLWPNKGDLNIKNEPSHFWLGVYCGTLLFDAAFSVLFISFHEQLVDC